MDHPAPEDDEKPQRPDWLVRPDNLRGVPETRRENDPPPPPSGFQGSGDFGSFEINSDSRSPEATPLEARPVPPRRAPEEPKAPEKKAWTAKASSVPQLRLVRSQEPEESRPVRTGISDEEEAGADEVFGNESPQAAPEPRARAAAPRPALPPLREAWWAIAFDALRTDRRIQFGIVGVVAALIAWSALIPREDKRVSIGAIRKDPDRYDRQLLTVEGRVGEVFHVGAGYAFNLHQGRDTLVVFTRTRVPVSTENARVKGTISTGFLDGLPRQALFEQP